MRRRSPADVELARRLLAHEGTGVAAATRVYARLTIHLEPIVGAAGLRALLTRSAKLTTSEYPRFAALTLEASAPPPAFDERLEACLGGGEPDEFIAATTALYGTLLGLLASFIGDALLWRLLRDAFPAANSLSDGGQDAVTPSHDRPLGTGD